MWQSGDVAAAREFGFAWFGKLETAGLDRAVWLVLRHDYAGRIGLRLDEIQPKRNCAIAEESLAGAEDHREDQHAEFVDQAVLPQRLKQLARSLYKKVWA